MRYGCLVTLALQNASCFAISICYSHRTMCYTQIGHVQWHAYDLRYHIYMPSVGVMVIPLSRVACADLMHSEHGGWSRMLWAAMTSLFMVCFVWEIIPPLPGSNTHGYQGSERSRRGDLIGAAHDFIWGAGKVIYKSHIYTSGSGSVCALCILDGYCD